MKDQPVVKPVAITRHHAHTIGNPRNVGIAEQIQVDRLSRRHLPDVGWHGLAQPLGPDRRHDRLGVTHAEPARAALCLVNQHLLPVGHQHRIEFRPVMMRHAGGVRAAVLVHPRRVVGMRDLLRERRLADTFAAHQRHRADEPGPSRRGDRIPVLPRILPDLPALNPVDGAVDVHELSPQARRQAEAIGVA